MEQFNTVLPAVQEEIKNEAGGVSKISQEPLLLDKVRQKFGLYGSISLVFGGAFTLLFYKAWVGINVFLFSALIILLLLIIMGKLSIQIRTGTKLYYTGVLLLGLSTCLTSSDILQFLNIIGILFLLDLSLLHQFYEDRKWEFVKHVGKMFGMILYSIASIGMPIIDGINYLKRTRVLKNDLLRNILIGIVISIPMLFIITALLSDADLIFGEIARKVFYVFFSADIFWIGIMFVFGFFACYCILCGALYKTGMEEKKALVKADPTIAVTFMAVLCLVYALFCGIQLIYLFANGLFTLPNEFTFAEYARKGFFELLAVTVINIAIMLLCNTLFRESRLLRLLVTGMTVCTYIMIASATYRMLLYIGAYHLTFLRLFVLLTLLIDAFVLGGIILFQYKKDFPVFRYCIIVISVCYITFSFAKPDNYIASYLADHQEILEEDDINYLTGELSLDAAPIVLSLINDAADQMDIQGNSISTVNDYYNKIAYAKNHTGIRDFNYSNYAASRLAEKYPNQQQ